MSAIDYATNKRQFWRIADASWLPICVAYATIVPITLGRVRVLSAAALENAAAEQQRPFPSLVRGLPPSVIVYSKSMKRLRELPGFRRGFDVSQFCRSVRPACRFVVAENCSVRIGFCAHDSTAELAE